MLVFNAELPDERLNVADTIKVQWNAYLEAGRLLLSDMGRVLISILEDTAGTHDAFCGASNERVQRRKYGDGVNWGAHPNARDRFVLGAAKFGLGRKDIHPCINWFKGVRMAADGATEPNVGPFAAGRQADAARGDERHRRAGQLPARARPAARRTSSPRSRPAPGAGPVTAPDDPVRNATPEALRAFLNIEDYFLR